MSQRPRDPRVVDETNYHPVETDDRVRHYEHTDTAADAPVTDERVGESAGVVRQERTVSDGSGSYRSERVVHDVAGEQRIGLGKTKRLVWLVFGVIEGLIALRVVLKLIGANPDNAFANFIYGFSDIFVRPFISLTGSPAAGAMVLEVPSIIAIAVYALLSWAIVQALQVLWPMEPRSSMSSSTTHDRFRG